jgi:hypothetical protein
MVTEGVVGLPEVDVDPLGDLMLDFLIDRDKEEPFLDFKETLSIAKDSPFAKVAKDILAFSNYGCGFVLIGFREREEEEEDVEGVKRRNFIPDGLPDAFHIDQADLQEKFNAYLKSPIQLPYREFFRSFDGAQRKFAAIYVPPSTSVLRPIKSGVYRDGKGREHKAFVVNSVLFRRGTQSVVASKEEVAWIEKRAERQGYRLSVLSGQPDLVPETVFSNLFEIIGVPDAIWTASLLDRERSGNANTQQGRERDVVYLLWRDRLVTFDDISKPESPLWNLIDLRSVRQEMLAAWVADRDKQRVVVWLLNKELRFLADRLGLLHEYRKQKFYFSCDGESRTETWTPRFRASSTLTVAQRMWAQQLGRFVFWHLAVYANFTYLGNRLFLELSPTIQLTENGREAIFGEREGTVITRLTYNRYNSTYLNNILFWISRFAEGKDRVELAQGRVLVNAKPVESKLSVGILFDRPSGEPVQEMPEIEIMGGAPRVTS